MHDELRLSVALQMTPEMGVGALINYSRPVDKYTRFISYTYYDRTEYLSDNQFQLLNRSKPPMPDTLATHVIVLVNWGIDAVAVLKLPSDDKLINAFDYVLKKLCISLSDDHASVVLSLEDKCFLEKIVHTEVFSNIPDLSKTKSIIDFRREIFRVKNDSNLLKPYNYNLCPIQYFYSVNNNTQSIFNELQQEHINRIEHYLLNLSRDFQTFRTAVDRSYPNLKQHLKDQIYAMRTKWESLEQLHIREIKRIHDLVIGVRRGEIEQEKIYDVLNNDKREQLIKSMGDFGYDVDVIRKKERMIGDLLKKDFEYRNATEYGVKNGDDKQTIEYKLLLDKKYEHMICSDDDLYKNKQSQWDALYHELLEERKEKPHLQFVYVDFSYCSHHLNDFVVIRTREKDTKIDVSGPVAIPPPPERPKNDGIINILLLGETGVGKSTFINAFVNYLLFDTLEQAQKKSVVLIPVSFVMTYDDDFKERLVTFGGMDTLSEEDHGHSGQSVTQRCKSYVFTLNDGNNKGKKLRIIDTPGIGDVRGLAQDDINMQHILSYINNLTHLNAVCILMKPNNARVNIFFRSCFTQLFDLFGENVRDNIIFCFTNARATFYTPGNTAPLLKKLLKSLPINDIPFIKENTFCFDSESFRYLVAVQSGIEMSDSQKNEYKDSWDKSSTESKRFLEYICTKMTKSLVPGECKSMKHIQLEISLLIRPMLETLRNILRNIVLWNAKLRTVSIELCPLTIKSPTAICLRCSRPSGQFGDFWISTDGLHDFHSRCQTCGCNLNDHYPIDYKLEYKLCRYAPSISYNEMTKMVDDLCQASAEFGHFLFGSTDTSQNDLFLVGFNRMMKEEDDICVNKTPCQLNLNLLNHVKQVKENYEEKKKKLSTETEHMQLANMYHKIQQMCKYPIIESQMTAVKEWHKLMIKYYEYDVPV